MRSGSCWDVSQICFDMYFTAFNRYKENSDKGRFPKDFPLNLKSVYCSSSMFSSWIRQHGA